jgi:hypothetical protein
MYAVRGHSGPRVGQMTPVFTFQAVFDPFRRLFRVFPGNLATPLALGASTVQLDATNATWSLLSLMH